MGGCVSKGSKEKDPDKAPYGDKDAEDKDKAAADDNKAAETAETPAKTEDTADKDNKEQEKEDEKEDDKEGEKKGEIPVAHNQVVIKVDGDGPASNKSVSVVKESQRSETVESSSTSSYTKQEVRSFGKSTVVSTEVEGSSPRAQELLEKLRSQGPDALPEGAVRTVTSSSERKMVTSSRSSTQSGDGPPKVESVTTTSTSISKTDPDGKTSKESTTTTEIKGKGNDPAIASVLAKKEMPAIKVDAAVESPTDEPEAKIEITAEPVANKA